MLLMHSTSATANSSPSSQIPTLVTNVMDSKYKLLFNNIRQKLADIAKPGDAGVAHATVKHDYILYGLLFTLLSLSQFLHDELGVTLDSLSTRAIVLFISVILVVYAYWSDYLAKPSSTRIRWLAFAWIAWGWLAVFNSTWIAPAIVRQTEWMLALMVTLSITGSIKKARTTPAAIAVIILFGLVIHASNMLSAWYSAVAPRIFNWVILFYPFTHIRHFGYLLAIFIVVSIYFTLYSSRSFLKCIAFAGFILATALLVWTGSRGSAVAVVATIALGFIFMATRERYITIATLLIGGPIAYLLQSFYWVNNPGLGAHSAIARTVTSDATGVATGRFDIWHRTVDFITDHPWFSLGPDGYRFWPEKFIESSQPHNALLQAGLEWGIVGALLFLAIIAYYWFKYIIHIKRSLVDASFASFLVVTVLLIHSLTDGTLYHSVSLMHFAVAFGVMISSIETSPRNHITNTIPRTFTLPKRGVMALLIAMMAGVVSVNGLVTWVQDQKPVPAPDSWSVGLVKAFPSSVRHGTSIWLTEWKKTYPHESLEWRTWLSEHSQRPDIYLLEQALDLQAQGNQEAARPIIQTLLDRTFPFEAARRRQLEKLLISPTTDK
jgi:hypothetical protein